MIFFRPLALDAYGYKNYICWIQNDNNKIEVAMILLEFYIPLWITFLYFFFVICSSMTKDRRKLNQKQIKIFYMIKLYPITLLICWIWGTIDMISEVANSDNNILKIFHVFFGGIQGFINSIFFFNTIEVKYIMKTQLCSMLPCFYNKRSRSYKHKLQEDPNESRDENIESQEQKSNNQELVEI